MQHQQWQVGIPITPVVKKLVIINAVLWVGLVLILQKWVLNEPYIYQWFGLIPESVILDFWLWQPLTYMFIHSDNVFHVLFNMLVLWMFGSEVEMRWGQRYFLTYYLVCGVGAGFLYLLGVLAYSLITGDGMPLRAPVVGASGATFGIMVAYALLFGERTIYFLMMFPMKARYFVMLIAGVEVLNLLSSGLSTQTANLAHLGGALVGFVFLKSSGWWGGLKRKATNKRGRNLRLVVNNNPPKYWN